MKRTYQSIEMYDLVALKIKAYEPRLLIRVRQQPEDGPLLLVIGTSPDKLLVRYPDGTSVEVKRILTIPELTLTPSDERYWDFNTPAMQKQMSYDSAYKDLCLAHGRRTILDTVKQHKPTPTVSKAPTHEVVTPAKITTNNMCTKEEQSSIIDSIDYLIADAMLIKRKLQTLIKQ